MKGYFLVYFLLESVCLGYTQTIDPSSIYCHQCTPLTQGVNCAEVPTNETLVPCTNLGMDAILVSCFSAFSNYDNAITPDIDFGRTNRSSETGIYRGCAHRHFSISDFCTYHEAQIKDSINVTVISCRTCEVDNCNTHRFTTDGFLADHGSSSTVMSAYVLIFSVICQVVLNNFK